MICVKIYWATEADGTPVPDSVPLEDGPLSYFGPFEDIAAAISWMENDYPDSDTDVYGMVADDFRLEEDVHINDPQSIFGDHPDEDIRDDSQELHGP